MKRRLTPDMCCIRKKAVTTSTSSALSPRSDPQDSTAGMIGRSKKTEQTEVGNIPTIAKTQSSVDALTQGQTRTPTKSPHSSDKANIPKSPIVPKSPQAVKSPVPKSPMAKTPPKPEKAGTPPQVQPTVVKCPSEKKKETSEKKNRDTSEKKKKTLNSDKKKKTINSDKKKKTINSDKKKKTINSDKKKKTINSDKKKKTTITSEEKKKKTKSPNTNSRQKKRSTGKLFRVQVTQNDDEHHTQETTKNTQTAERKSTEKIPGRKKPSLMDRLLRKKTSRPGSKEKSKRREPGPAPAHKKLSAAAVGLFRKAGSRQLLEEKKTQTHDKTEEVVEKKKEEVPAETPANEGEEEEEEEGTLDHVDSLPNDNSSNDRKRSKEKIGEKKDKSKEKIGGEKKDKSKEKVKNTKEKSKERKSK